MKVQVLILNYRTPGLTISCLESVAGGVVPRSGSRVVIVDNASGDGSPQVIEKAIADRGWSGWAALLPLGINLGFAGGNNAAIRRTMNHQERADYLVLLNSDTIVRPRAITSLVEFMDDRPNVGVAGSRLEDPHGLPQRSAFRFPNIWSELDSGFRFGPLSRLLKQKFIAPPVRAEAHETDWVSGACMIIRRQVLEQIGLLDEGYFMYYEDVDFCLAVRRAGWSVWYVPQARVVHLVGQSSGMVGRKTTRRLPQYWFEARRRYFVKNHGRLYAIAVELCWAIGYVTWRVRRVLQRKPDTDPRGWLWDTIRWSIWPTLVAKQL
jgi:N-acetylglucosaminyl-diphospho-decaprenol L-rhamnosyltransferase